MLAGAPSASAALDFQPCTEPKGVQCAHVDVPIDRSGRVPGTFSLLVHRVPATLSSSRPPVVFLAGGPGQTNTDITALAAKRFAGMLERRDMIVFAQRGTGPNAIHCDALERGDDPATAVPACAEQLGPARNFFTTRDSADDLEDVRAQLGADKVALYGASYGSFVALAYAIRHPQHVETYVSDSTYAPELNEDAFGVGLFAEAPGLARAICHSGRCAGITKDPWTDLLRLFDRLNAKPLKARTFDARGHAHAVTISGLSIAALLPEIDFEGHLRAELPRAMASALRGDGALLARLIAGGPDGPPPDPRLAVNQTLLNVTHCEEDVHPFDRTASPDDRLTQARARLGEIPPDAFAPTGPDIAFLLSNVPICAYWPMLPEQPDFGGGAPADVPALFLHGQFDLRTTQAATDSVAKRFPQATVFTVPDGGHSPSRRDLEPCARSLVIRWFASGPAKRGCVTDPDAYAPRRLAPRRVRSRAQAARLTVADALDQLEAGSGGRVRLQSKVRGGGLRGGSFRGLPGGRLRLRGYVFVKGFPVTGTVRPTGPVVLRVAGRKLRLTRLPRLTITGRYMHSGKFAPAA